EALVRHRIQPAVAELGWVTRPGESELIRQLRGDLLRALGTIGNDRAVQARAAELYADDGLERGERDSGTLDPNVLPALIAVLALGEGVIGLATPELERDVLAFFAERKIDFGGKTRDQYLEQLHVAVVWRERDRAVLRHYLTRFAAP